MRNTLPIEYTAVIEHEDGHESPIDLEEPGWFTRDDVRQAVAFTLQPKPGTSLAIVSARVARLPDGTKPELVFASRVYGRVGSQVQQLVSTPEQSVLLFRLYGLGWKIRLGDDKEFISMLWSYPAGTVVQMMGTKLDGEGQDIFPPYVDQMIEHHWAMHLAGLGPERVKEIFGDGAITTIQEVTKPQ